MLHSVRQHGAVYLMKCPMKPCPYQSTSWHAYKAHFRRYHRHCDNDFRLHEIVEFEENFTANDEKEQNSSKLKPEGKEGFCTDEVLAKSLLDLESCSRVPKSVISNIVQTAQEVTSALLGNIERDILKHSELNTNAKEEMVQLLNSHKMDSWTTTLLSDKGRMKYFSSKYLLVHPEEVLLGCRTKIKSGQKALKRCTAAIVPLENLLEGLLQSPEIFNCLMNPKKTTDNLMRDISDGEFIRTHKLTREGKPWLKIVLYYDELEMQNPLRSSQAHKLGCFYFTLANIPAVHRSSLQNIFVLAIAKSCDIKFFGVDKILHDFLCVVGKLQGGIQMRINGKDHTIWGDLVLVLADHPAASLLGGFKESASWSHMPCRMCYTTNDAMKINFKLPALKARTLEEYKEQCKIFTDNALTKQTKVYWAKQYGLKRESVLTKVNFPVVTNIVQDAMHVLLEGCFGHVLALFLKRCADVGEYTLEKFNAELEQFPYAYQDKSKAPKRIMDKDLENVFVRQKATSTLLLAYIAPFIFGKVFDVDNEYYRNFLGIVQIVQLAFSSIVDNMSEGALAQVIQSYCFHFQKLYPHVVPKPKMHFMLHFVEQVRKFGPLRNQNTLRFEGKHGSFKEKRWKNFVNLPMSLLKHHQLLLASKMSLPNGQMKKDFVSGADKVGPGREVAVATLHHCVKNVLPMGMTKTLALKYVRINGLLYKPGAVIVLGESRSTACVPKLGVLERLFLNRNNNYIFQVRRFAVGRFIHKFNAFELHKTNDLLCVNPHHLTTPFPMPAYEITNCLLFTARHSTTLHGY